MKYLKFFESGEEIESLCEKYGITNYSINPDRSIDVDAGVYLQHKILIEIPIRFGRVTGDFDCSNNNLTTLEGCPKEVGKNFYCYKNKLKTLHGSPISVGGGFYCNINKLISLEGISKKVGGDFDCSYNQLTSLK